MTFEDLEARDVIAATLHTRYCQVAEYADCPGPAQDEYAAAAAVISALNEAGYVIGLEPPKQQFLIAGVGRDFRSRLDEHGNIKVDIRVGQPPYWTALNHMPGMVARFLRDLADDVEQAGETTRIIHRVDP